MATVNFNCAMCGKLMAVSEEHLGKRVRCPHCQQIIKAPASLSDAKAPVSETSSEPGFLPPQAVLSESIFEEGQDEGGDDLFGGAAVSLVEMPPEMPPARPYPELPASPFYAAQPPPGFMDEPTLADQPIPFPLPSGVVTEATVTYLPQESPALPADIPALEGQTAPAGTVDSFAPGARGLEPEAPADELGTVPTPVSAGKTRRPSMAVPTLLIFLVPYSIVVTIAAAMLYFQLQNRKDPLELLPDPKPEKKQGGAERVINDRAISRRLLVEIGGSISIGDLEVVPKAVVRVANNSLALKVFLRNKSRDIAFNPVSQEFNKYVREVSDRRRAPRPFTFLEIGKEKVYGGDWLVLRKDGEPFNGRLMPQEEMTAVLVTDPKDGERIKELDQLTGPLVWRIQVRRGLVSYKGKDYSTTGVVGVVFKAQDVSTEEKQLGLGGI